VYKVFDLDIGLKFKMVETAGGYDYKYISEVPEDLICSLCHFPFKNPVHVEKCGHIYCKECFQQTKNHAAEKCINHSKLS